ncbi:MAG: TetR/AcrR family transcriptional regulator [Phenylobacterium sp.]
MIDRKISEEPRRRGRPATFDRRAALDAAAPLFWRHGYEGASVAQLTAAMGVAPPTLYAAFGSKEQLFRDAMRHYHETCGGLARVEAFVAEPQAYQALSTYLRDIAQAFADPTHPPGCMVATTGLHAAADSQAASQTAAEFRGELVDLLHSKFDGARQSGQLPETVDAAALARFYTAVIQGMSAQACDGAGAGDLTGVADAALAAWPGVRPG